MRIWAIVLLAIVVPFLAVAQTPSTGCGFFTVRPASEALVFDRNGNIKRKVGPGIQTCVPILESFLIEDTHSERSEDVKSSWREDSCEITVSVFWNISDLEKYHTKGRDTVAVSVIPKLVQDALENAELSDIGTEELLDHLYTSLREDGRVLDEFGVNHIHSYSRLENCTQE